MEIAMSVEWLERIERKIDAQGRQLEAQSGRLDVMDTRFQHRTRFDAIDTRFDGIDTRLDGIDTRLDGIDTRLDGIDTRLVGIDARLDGIDARLDGIDARLDDIDSQLEAHGTRLDRHEQLLEDNGKEVLRIGVLVEKMQDDIRGVAEGVIGVSERMDRAFTEVLGRLDNARHRMRRRAGTSRRSSRTKSVGCRNGLGAGDGSLARSRPAIAFCLRN